MNRRMIKTAAMAAVMAVAAMPAMAQTESNGLYLDEIPSQEELEKEAAGNIGGNGEAQWYVAMDYAGFEFELPAGLQIQKGSSLIGKSSDGTFGVSMSNVSKQGSNQKMAFELCRRLATSMHLPNPKVEKVNYGKCGGAKASGMLEGQQVTVLVLPYNDQEVTTVILASPNREEWVNHFLRTLKR